MNKLFQTLFMLVAMASQANAVPAPVKIHNGNDANRLLSFNQPSRRNRHSKDLVGLYSVKEFQSKNIKQPYSEFDLLYQSALAGQSELENITELVALLTDTKTFSSGVKSKLRAVNKINSELAGDSDRITDLARTSIVAKDIPALMKAFELIEQETQLLRIKNRFQNPGESGYRDLSLLVRLPESKIVVEVQLHLEAFSVIKNGAEHDNYQQIQEIERLQLIENRPLSEIEQASINKLRDESQQMYMSAWNQYLSA